MEREVQELNEDDEFEDDDDMISDEELMEPGIKYRRSAPKVGRNDPCPCGSGKKFKKCHGV